VCVGLSIYRGRLALNVINDLDHDHDAEKGLKIVCCGALSFVLYSSALKCRSFPSHSFCSSLPFLYLTLGVPPS
jgi:hypothetical protein